jgi:hypothetical protein
MIINLKEEGEKKGDIAVTLLTVTAILLPYFFVCSKLNNIGR